MKNIITFIIILFGISANAQVTVNYTYDDLQRLTQASYSNGVGIQYSYDTLGNRTQETKTSSLSVVDVENVKNMSLYPNPFVEELNISSKEQNILQIQLFDLSGKLIQNEKVNSKNAYILKTKNLASGVYLITIITDKGKETYKVIKK